jgi:hypothetical protein
MAAKTAIQRTDTAALTGTTYRRIKSTFFLKKSNKIEKK